MADEGPTREDILEAMLKVETERADDFERLTGKCGSRRNALEKSLREVLEAAEYFEKLVGRLASADDADDLEQLVSGINGDYGNDCHNDRGAGPWSKMARARTLLRKVETR